MITVLAYFYHPDLGTVRGTVIDGVPMLSCRELSIFLARFSSDELDDILRQNYHTEDVVVARFSADGLEYVIRSDYHTEDVTVPVSVDVNGIAKTEKLLFIGIDAAYGILKLSPNGQGYKYSVWLGDFVFPMLMQMNGTTEVKRDAQYFYWECTDPKHEKTAEEMLNDHFFDIFD